MTLLDMEGRVIQKLPHGGRAIFSQLVGKMLNSDSASYTVLCRDIEEELGRHGSTLRPGEIRRALWRRRSVEAMRAASGHHPRTQTSFFELVLWEVLTRSSDSWTVTHPWNPFVPGEETDLRFYGVEYVKRTDASGSSSRGRGRNASKSKRGADAKPKIAPLDGGMLRRLEEIGCNTTKYHTYLQSDEWQQVRRRIILRAEGICERCGSSQSLDVHHKTYRHLGDERDDELEALCKPCHEIADRERVFDAPEFDLDEGEQA